MFGDDLPKTIKDISATNKCPIFESKIPAYTKTGNVYQNRGLSAKRKTPAECSTISVLPTNSAKVSVQKEHCYAKPLPPDFQIQVSELVHKIKFLNEKSKAGGISEYINN